MTNSDCSSSSSSNDFDFDQADLLEVIGILLLPIGTRKEFDIVAAKDGDIIELLEQLYGYYDVDDDDVKLWFAKIVNFINNNRKDLGKRRLNMKTLITEGLNDIN